MKDVLHGEKFFCRFYIIIIIYVCKYNYRQWEKFIRLNTIAAAIKFTLPPVSRSLCTSPPYSYKFVLQFILIHFLAFELYVYCVC